MSTNSEQYWRSQLAQTEAEYEHIIQGLRDEVELQQRRCGELVHEQAMLRSTAAADIRDFCQQYVANVKQQQQQQQQQARPGSASTWMSHGAKKDIDSVPLPALFAFLHEYSHGLLQLPENRRKRLRQDTQLSPLHHRLRQRMLARHRRTGKEDELMDEWCTGEYGDGSCVTSPSEPYMSAPPSSSWPTVPQWHADPEGKRQMAPLGEGASPDMGGRSALLRCIAGSTGVLTTTTPASGAVALAEKASATARSGAIIGGGDPVGGGSGI
ncbi:hypothetical protein JKF63_05010 [Porcisia hertigi]|uniref:Uncharacterized protein n=1 Tax=Porcisia hertigi TaxID=2761500 RepID=A0A836IW23_9TRYP|nr:hypothetical protein JKF63_05010 [Porcisia hertigi]